MSSGHITAELHLVGERIAVPSTALPTGSGIVVPVRVILDGTYTPADLAFAKAVQNYADRLATESANQAESEKAPGATNVEVTESSVIRAQESLDKKVALQVNARSRWIPYALAGSPIFSGATGVMGSFLHSPLQIAAFVVTAGIAALCIIFLAKKGLK